MEGFRSIQCSFDDKPFLSQNSQQKLEEILFVIDRQNGNGHFRMPSRNIPVPQLKG
jgi:hypothetical protein